VVRGRASITNLGWEMEESELARDLGLSRVRLLNDLQAIGYAIPKLGAEDLRTLNAGDPVPCGAIAVIAPGTGLGEAFLVWEAGRYEAHPTEGGHADFAPRDETQIGLLRYLLGKMDHVSYERVCSGLGIPNIYAYLRDSGLAEAPDSLAEEIAAASDPTPLIVNNALSGEGAAPICRQTLSTFVSILGAEAGNTGLQFLATGGVYLGGGIPRRILPALEDGTFMKAFRTKGRFREFLSNLPVHVILNPKAALLGAAAAVEQ
jgi:glucokinase